MPQLVMREAIKKGLEEALQNDPNVLILGEDIGAYGGAYAVTDGFLDKFGPERIKDTPISEATFIGTGIGAASAGLRPIIELMSISFSLVGFDQIVNMAANIRYMSGGQIDVPMVIRAPTGAGVQLAATHSQSFETWLAEVPGLYCVCPSNPKDALGLLRTAIKDNNPVIFLENEILYGRKFERETSEEVIPIGKAKIFQEGTDVTLISFGIGMTYAIEAADILSKEGISTEIIDLRTIRPLDKNTIISSVKKTNRCITIEEGFPICSVGNNITALIMQEAFDYLDAPVINCTGKDVPMPYAENLEKLALVNTQEVVDRAKEIIYR